MTLYPPPCPDQWAVQWARPEANRWAQLCPSSAALSAQYCPSSLTYWMHRRSRWVSDTKPSAAVQCMYLVHMPEPPPVPILADEWVPCWSQTRPPLSQQSRYSASRPPSSNKNVHLYSVQCHRVHKGVLLVQACSRRSWGHRVKQEIFVGDITHRTFVRPHQSNEINPVLDCLRQ